MIKHKLPKKFFLWNFIANEHKVTMVNYTVIHWLSDWLCHFINILYLTWLNWMASCHWQVEHIIVHQIQAKIAS